MMEGTLSRKTWLMLFNEMWSFVAADFMPVKKKTTTKTQKVGERDKSQTETENWRGTVHMHYQSVKIACQTHAQVKTLHHWCTTANRLISSHHNTLCY